MYRAIYFTDPLLASLFQIYFFLVGLIVGSFLNVCIYRIPLGKSIIHPRSRCPRCEVKIPWYHNIPVFSFIYLRGKCARCGAVISVVYPLVELLTGMFFWYLYRSFGVSVPFLIYGVFGCSLIVLLFIDYFHRLLPSKITFPVTALGLLSSIVNPFLSPLESLTGFLVGGGFLLFVYLAHRWIRKREGMGHGDIVLMAMVGAYLGWRHVLLVLFAGSLLGTLIAFMTMVFLRKSSDFPYPLGTFIAFAALLSIFWGDWVWSLYFRI